MLQIVNVKPEIFKSLKILQIWDFFGNLHDFSKGLWEGKNCLHEKNTIQHNTYIIHMHAQMFWFYKRAGSFPQKRKRRKITEMKYKRKSQKTAFLWLKNNIHKNCYFQNIKSEIHH